MCTLAEKMPSNPHLRKREKKDYNPDDPPRIYLKNCGYPGAAFSRSVGDAIAESIGVIAKGEVITKPIVTGLNSILCGSDGVWNFCTPDDLACSVKYSTDLAKTAVVSVLNIFLRWIKTYGSSDDITLIVLRFPPLSPSLEDRNGDWDVALFKQPSSLLFSQK